MKIGEYVEAFIKALGTIRDDLEDAEWWPRDQPSTTALSWAIGLEISKSLLGRSRCWAYSCWGSGRGLKRRVLRAYGLGHGGPGRGSWGNKGTFYPRQFLVDFSVYPPKGNRMLLAMESEAYADHAVGSKEIDPYYDYNWDFGKLLYLNARERVFVARVRKAKDRASLWKNLASVVRDEGTNLRGGSLAAFILASRSDEEHQVGLWSRNDWIRRPLGSWSPSK